MICGVELSQTRLFKLLEWSRVYIVELVEWSGCFGSGVLPNRPSIVNKNNTFYHSAPGKNLS
jgi:hypothetical protein